MQGKFKKLKKGLAALLSLAMVLGFSGLSGTANAAKPDGYDEDWSDRYEVEIRQGSSTGKVLDPGDVVDVEEDFYVTGTIKFPTVTTDPNAVMGGSNIANNYAGKKCYVATISNNLIFEDYQTKVTDRTETVSYGTISISKATGIISFTFDPSTEEGHIGNSAYEGELVKDIVFTYKAKLNKTTIKIDAPELDVTFHDYPFDTFKLKFVDDKPHPVEVSKKNVTFSEDDGTATWAITLTNKGQQNGNNVFTVTDTFDKEIPPLDGANSFSVDKGSISDVVIDEANHKFTLKYTADADFNVENETRTITYKSKLYVHDKCKIGYETQKTNNTVDIVNETTKDVLNKDTATITISHTKEKMIAKTGGTVKFGVDPQTGKTTATSDWTITAHTRGIYNHMTELWIEDRLSHSDGKQRLEYVEGSLKITITADGVTYNTVNYDSAGSGRKVSFETRNDSASKEAYMQTTDANGKIYRPVVKNVSNNSSTHDKYGKEYYGGLDLMYVGELAGVPKTAKYVDFVIKYETVMKDYDKYLTEYKPSTEKYRNSAELLFEIEDYNGPGTGKTEEVDYWVDFDQSFIKAGIKKTTATASPEDGYVRWAFTLDPTTQGNVTVADILPEGLDFIPDRANIVIKKVITKINSEGKPYEADANVTGYTVTPDVTKTVSGNGKDVSLTFSIVKDGDKTKEITDKIKVYYYTYLNNPVHYNDNNSHDYVNTAILKYDDAEMARAKAQATIKSRVINKKGLHDTANGAINWTIDVNQNKVKMGTADAPVYIVDYLPLGTDIDFSTLKYELCHTDSNKKEVVDSSTIITKTSGNPGTDLYYNYDPSITAEDKDSKGNITAEYKGKLTVYLPNFEKGYYGRITYATKIDTSSDHWKWDAISYDAKTGKFKSTGVKATNKAEFHNDVIVTPAPTVTSTVEFTFREVKKIGKIVDKDIVEYNINLNSEKRTLPKGTAYKDQMTFGMNYQQHTLDLFVGAVKDKGEVYLPENAKKLELGTDYTTEFATYKDSNGKDCEYMILKLQHDITEAIVVRYYVRIPDKSAAESFSNTIYMGETKFGEDSEETFTSHEIENARAYADIETSYRAHLIKVDADDDSLPVEGAEYGIFKDEDCTQLVEKKLTDKYGNITFWDLELTATYYVKELAAPEGYELDPEVHEVVIKDKVNEVRVTDKKIPDTVYSVVLTKVSESDENLFLEGAIFGIYSDEACTELIATRTTGEDGKLTFDSLEYEMTYYIQEIEAPLGYILDTTVIPVTIEQEVTELTVTNEEEDVLGEEFENDEEVLGEEFVATGDKGQLGLFLLLGTISLMVITGYAFFSKKRVSK